MKKTKFRRLAAMAASLLCCLIFTVPAYAQSSEPQPETVPSPAETEAEPETQNPFTTDGTGTVVDNATDEDGKEFYTITTADESVFYLVIDKQKTSENVYFLNTVSGSFSETRVMFPRKHSLPISVTVYPSSLSGTIRFAAVPEYPVICAVLSDRTLYVKSPDLLSVERTETVGSSGGASGCFSASGASFCAVSSSGKTSS